MIHSVRRNLAITFAVLTGFLAACSTAIAHPHGWIDLRTEVVLDENGFVSALTVNWNFDEFYSAFVLEDIIRAGEDTEAALAQLTVENLNGLKEFDYFTKIYSDGSEIEIGEAADALTSIANDRLRMTFTIPLSHPVNPRTSAFEYAVYDPTYYIEILHISEEAIALQGPRSDTCKIAMEKPNPDASAISLAASLGQTEVGPDNLGQLFAEVVKITCPK